jgi:hypothetical protein
MLVWLTAYLWSVPLALYLSSALDWQYDGDAGWWVVAAYTAPILLLTEPFGGAVSNEVLAVVYLTALLLVTVAVVRIVKLNSRGLNGS